MEKKEWWEIEEDHGEAPKRKGFMDVARDEPMTIFWGFVAGVLGLLWFGITFGE